MADEGNAEAAVVAATPPTPDTAPIIDGDGNLRDGWTGILDEDLRDNSFLNESKTLQGMARSVVSARGMVGKDKIVKPTEASSEADWDEFYTAGGKPQTFTDYGLARPEELPEENYSQERTDKYAELFYKIGLNTTQAQSLFNAYNSEVVAELKGLAQEKELSDTELKDGLYSDWGNAFEQKKHMGNMAVEQGADSEEHKTRLTEKFGNDPDFIRFAANVGGKFMESSSPDAKTIPTPGDIQEQIDAAQANPAYGTEYMQHGFTKQQHKNQVQLVQRLFNEKMTSSRKTG